MPAANTLSSLSSDRRALYSRPQASMSTPCRVGYGTSLVSQIARWNSPTSYSLSEGLAHNSGEGRILTCYGTFIRLKVEPWPRLHHLVRLEQRHKAEPTYSHFPAQKRRPRMAWMGALTTKPLTNPTSSPCLGQKIKPTWTGNLTGPSPVPWETARPFPPHPSSFFPTRLKSACGRSAILSTERLRPGSRVAICGAMMPMP